MVLCGELRSAPRCKRAKCFNEVSGDEVNVQTGLGDVRNAVNMFFGVCRGIGRGSLDGWLKKTIQRVYVGVPIRLLYISNTYCNTGSSSYSPPVSLSLPPPRLLFWDRPFV